jgi:hypothetical protein
LLDILGNEKDEYKKKKILENHLKLNMQSHFFSSSSNISYSYFSAGKTKFEVFSSKSLFSIFLILNYITSSLFRLSNISFEKMKDKFNDYDEYLPYNNLLYIYYLKNSCYSSFFSFFFKADNNFFMFFLHFLIPFVFDNISSWKLPNNVSGSWSSNSRLVEYENKCFSFFF